ncbi:Type IV pilin PilA [Myxococcus hansupus]|uniref:Type IV pilin PilA n=1 Tax=Pseudomyxococcus hansupus TaxID=1297742 RepID=A0A0H4WRX1_9BACT|nr:fimbrial protein [Myxococcus hansupus]AKQ64328.1 Type IV pilin PilA [Myxococcus hansupus]
MAKLECPKCGELLEVTGRSPGVLLTCACGNVARVPSRVWGLGLRGLAAALGLLLLCPCAGVLAAIAIPNYNKLTVRSKQRECKTNLRALFTAQRSHAAEHDAYAPGIVKTGFLPEPGNRYAYFMAAGPISPRDTRGAEVSADAVGIGVDRSMDDRIRPVTLEDLPPWVTRQLGVSGACPECQLTMACAGNIDVDDTLDVWLISTRELTDADGSRVPPGVPVNVVNDVNE